MIMSRLDGESNTLIQVRLIKYMYIPDHYSHTTPTQVAEETGSLKTGTP